MGRKISEMMPGKYLKAGDLQGKQCTVVIETVEHENIGDETKLLLSFRGKTKGMVLNITNQGTLTMLLGDDVDEGWIGATITIYPTTTLYMGKPVPCIRIMEPHQMPRGATVPTQAPVAPPPTQPPEQPPAQPASVQPTAEQGQDQPPEWVPDPPAADDIPF